MVESLSPHSELGWDPVNFFDSKITVFVNSFAHRWWTVDESVRFLAVNHLLKAGLLMTVFYFLWFQPSDEAGETEGVRMSEKRQIMLYTLLVCIPGLMVVRFLAADLPFRQRPIFNPALHLRTAFSFEPGGLEPWSSFPSDHMVLVIALATGMFLVNRRIGLFVYIYSFLCIALPRLYLGIHYPSDLLVGALLGWAIAYSAKWVALRSLVARGALRLSNGSSGLFYAGFFFLTFQTAYMYDPLRAGAHVAVDVLRIWLKFLH